MMHSRPVHKLGFKPLHYHEQRNGRSAHLSHALVRPMQAIQGVHALYTQTAQNADDELTVDRELAHVKVEGNQKQRRRN